MNTVKPTSLTNVAPSIQYTMLPWKSSSTARLDFTENSVICNSTFGNSYGWPTTIYSTNVALVSKVTGAVTNLVTGLANQPTPGLNPGDSTSLYWYFDGTLANANRGGTNLFNTSNYTASVTDFKITYDGTSFIWYMDNVQKASFTTSSNDYHIQPVFRTTNSGSGYTDIWYGQLTGSTILPVSIQPSSLVSDFNVCLAGTGGSGKILRSTDSGSTWTDLGQQYSQTQIYSLVSLGDGVVLAGTGAGGKILRSTNYGASGSWTDLGQQFSQQYIYSLASLGGGVVLAGTGNNGKILRSTDSGSTWSDLETQFTQTQIYSFTSLGGGIVLAGTSAGGKILRSTDFGATWSDLGQQGGQAGILSLEFFTNPTLSPCSIVIT
jgi:hypothetical protein